MVWDLRRPDEPLQYHSKSSLFGDVWEVRRGVCGQTLGRTHARSPHLLSLGMPLCFGLSLVLTCGRLHTCPQARFDISEQSSSVLSNVEPPVVMCTEDGLLTVATQAANQCYNLVSEAGAINTFDVDAGTGQDILCGSQNECLVYLRRPGYHS